MPNTREKLIELLRGATETLEEQKERWILGGKVGEKPGIFSCFADHLIANGVRLEEKQATSDESKWIPVTERLPKGGNGEDVAENVIAYLNNGEVIEQVCTGWLSGDEWWLIVGDEDTHTAWGLGAVTHWMPLPEPPKGE